MKTLRELKEINRKLKAKLEVDEEMKKMNKERKRLAKENFYLKHKNKIEFLRKIGSGAKAVGKKLGSNSFTSAYDNKLGKLYKT